MTVWTARCNECGSRFMAERDGLCWECSTKSPLRASTPEPAPLPGSVDIAPLVLADIQARVEMGSKKYGTKLQAHNGRDALVDALQEAIDLVFYLRQAIYERDNP